MKDTLLAQLTRNELRIPQVNLDSTAISTALSITLGVAGAVALIVVIIGAIQYTMSRGDPQATAKAKDTIMYALIGVLVSVVALSVVRFVARNVL